AVYGQQLAETGQIIGCASPANEFMQADKSLAVNDKSFLEIISEVFCDWIPQLTSVGLQAVWAGYYVEPRMIVDPAKGLMVGLRGHGFMLSQYFAKMYIDQLMGRPVPAYFSRLSLEGDGIQEIAFK
ncbi:MAG: ferredoxin, partial [Salinivirgaceae bacterium]|nr:ferredoxin [Salinivirgaceae bacterium]